MEKMNYQRYSSNPKVKMEVRSWPDAEISKAPVWCSVDLRDGNQALNQPMTVDQKMQMFELLVRIGFKEIEVGFPSASEIEFAFVRKLIEENRIPADVTIQVLTQARKHLIERTVESIQGAPKAIVHLYNSTSTVQREVVFNKGMQEIKQIAVDGARLIKELSEKYPKTKIQLEYSPESFTQTELEYALEVCEAVIDQWNPTKEDPVIINLPATVEVTTANIFADRIEWFCRNMKYRDAAIISVHTHNDRGCAVAAAELAVMAGAQRVEGALFGNGERSGNMDIMVMAMNLFSQGIDPQLDFTQMNQIMDVYSQCTQMEIHPRHPYCGSLVYTAYSGSHQDAINKGMKAMGQKDSSVWNVPYLPVDPQDIGRSYEAIIRINSQSGKGGVAYVLENHFGINIPKWMQPHFGKIVQRYAEEVKSELSAEEVYSLFKNSYISQSEPYSFVSCHIDSDKYNEEDQNIDTSTVTVELANKGETVVISETGNGPVNAFVKGLEKVMNVAISLEEYAEHAIAHGSDANAIAYIMVKNAKGGQYYGAGIDSSITHASIKAVLSAVNHFV